MTLVSRNRGLTAIALIAAAIVAGCQSTSLDDFAPQAGLRDTGTYPDLNVRKEAATSQLTGAETDQKVAELKAAQASAAAQGGAAASRTAEFRQAQQNQQKTLKEIEGD